jgi:hypothetical protein
MRTSGQSVRMLACLVREGATVGRAKKRPPKMPSRLQPGLPPKEIEAIRREYRKGILGRGLGALAKRYGCSRGTVWRIVNGITTQRRRAYYQETRVRPKRTDAFVLCGPYPYPVAEDGHVLLPREIKAVRDEFVRLQGGNCPICQAPTNRFDLDHNPATGRPRGALCGEHNRALGSFTSDELRRAAAYLGAATDAWYEDYQARLVSALAVVEPA